MGKRIRLMTDPLIVSTRGGKPRLRELAAELGDLRARLTEAQETLDAIRTGDVDALVVSGPDGEQVYTLKGAEYAYRALVEAMNEGAATIGADGTVLYCNQQLSDLVQLPQEQVIGRPLSSLLAGACQEEFQVRLAGAIAGENSRSEMHFHTQNGSVAVAHVSLSRLRVGEAPAACMIVTDLREHKKRDELIAAGNLARSILEHAAEAIAVCDREGRIIHANDALKRLCGMDPHFQHFDEVLPLEIVTAGLGGQQQTSPFSVFTALSGEALKAEEAILERKQRQTWLLLTAGPMWGGNEVVGCVLSLTDITERKLAEKALRNSEKLAATGQLAATIAHEINNPLTAMFNLLYLIQHESRLTRARVHANQAVAELSRVAHITKQTLAFYRDAGSPEKVRLSELLDDILSLFRKEFEARKVTATRKYAAPDEVYCFPGEIRQVFSNVLRNSLEASPEGGRISVRVRPSRRGHLEGVGVFVFDNGPGIAAEYRQAIFEPFFTTKGAKGTGLGLWVANDLVQKHGGVIRVRSSVSPGRSGSCFYVFIPTGRADKRLQGPARRTA